MSSDLYVQYGCGLCAPNNWLNFDASEFLEASGLGTRNKPQGVRALVQAVLGNGSHLWMWDYQSLKCELKIQGFIEVRRAEFNDSIDSAFSDVEESSRFVNAVAVECKKPLHIDKIS